MEKYINKISERIKEAINEKDLDFLGNALVEFMRYGIVMDEDNIILITSEARDIIGLYSVIIDQFLENDDQIKEMTSKSIEPIEKFVEFTKKKEITSEDKSEFFNLLKRYRVNSEKDYNKYWMRRISKIKFRIPTEITEEEK